MKRSPIARKTPLKRTGIKRKTGTAMPKSVIDFVKTRANGSCEARTPRCVGGVDHLHHKILRSQGGKHTVENLLAVCMPCHTFIHNNPQVSVDNGWIVRPQAA